MHTLREIVKLQTWLGDIKKIPAAVAAVKLFAQRSLPAHAKKEIRAAANLAGIPYFDIVCLNLSYEIAMLALTPGKFDIGGLWKSLAGVKATRVGCTTFGHWTTRQFTSPGEEPITLTSDVMFARNLDWPDPEGLLKESTELRSYDEQYLDGLFRTKRVRPFQNLTFPGYCGVLTGYAPGRFAVALNAVYNDGPIMMGAAPSFLTRKVLEECDTFEEALKKLSQTPLVCGALYTLIDASSCPSVNAGVVIERSADKYAIRHAEKIGENDYVIVATNDAHILTGEPNTKAMATDIGATSCTRFQSVIRSLKEAREVLPIPVHEPVPEDEIRIILHNQEFGCTIHRALFNASTADKIAWN